ncbi:hypothetical protein BJ912DRAFT_977287 [Pholiota molesta]|nr:hypothetical protein BJ912DRAFT_977287 [Pholiota molesta]
MTSKIPRKKGKKSPTSSSSSYETKSGYHSRSSSFSSESHIPGSIRGGEEFPFGYPMPVVNSLDSLLGVHNTPRRKKRTPEEEAPPAPAATMDVDEDIKREKLFRAAQAKQANHDEATHQRPERAQEAFERLLHVPAAHPRPPAARARGLRRRDGDDEAERARGRAVARDYRRGEAALIGAGGTGEDGV